MMDMADSNMDGNLTLEEMQANPYVRARAAARPARSPSAACLRRSWALPQPPLPRRSSTPPCKACPTTTSSERLGWFLSLHCLHCALICLFDSFLIHSDRLQHADYQGHAVLLCGGGVLRSPPRPAAWPRPCRPGPRPATPPVR